MCNLNPQIEILNETLADSSAIETLTAQVFGPGRFIRAAFKLREGTSLAKPYSFVAKKDGKILGSVRQTAIKIDNHDALLLGPLAVSQEVQNQGIGKQLLQKAIQSADADPQNPYELILLVGDLAYYTPHGFKPIPHKRVLFPWPVNYQRVLAYELKEKAILRVSGLAQKA